MQKVCELSSQQAAGALSVEEILFVGRPFDPTNPLVRRQLFDRLGMPCTATVVQLKQEGGLNEGMWVLASPTGSLILKLVPHQRRHHLMPTEAEQFRRLAREHPSVYEDKALAFPIKIFACREQSRDIASHDLLVMRKAPGTCFSELICHRWTFNQKAELWRDLRALGAFLADVHRRHQNMQHGDFTPSNVFFDEATRSFTLVDLGDFGPQVWDAVESDVERFHKGLKLLSQCYGAEFFTEGFRNFQSGYKERRALPA